MSKVAPDKKVLNNTPRDSASGVPTTLPTIVFSSPLDSQKPGKASSSKENTFDIGDDSMLADFRMVRADEFDFRGVQPRYQSSLLETLLTARFVRPMQTEVKMTPMDFYDSELYSIGRNWHTWIPGTSISLEAVKLTHHVSRLKEHEAELTPADFEAIDDEVETLLSTRPSVFYESSVVKEVLAFVSALAIKHKLVSAHTFAYRQSDRALTVKLLDLEELNRDVFTMECLWLSTMVEDEPLSPVCGDIVKQYALILKEVCEKLVNFIGTLNSDCNFVEVPSIERLVAARNPRIIQTKGIIPDLDAEVVHYQRVETSRGLFGVCIRSVDLRNARTLKQLVADFTSAYILFEQELIANFLLV